MNNFIREVFVSPLIGFIDFLSYANGSQYEIPVFQRNYTWEAEMVKRWLDDIYDVLLCNTKIHYMGTLVYSERYSNNIHKRLVIDGQQRLTTLFLFFYALKNVLKSDGRENDANFIETSYLINLAHKNDEQLKLKLKPLISDNDVYKKIINEEPFSTEDMETTVYKRYNEIKEYIIKQKNSIYFNEIIERINNVYFNIFRIPESDSIQCVFETINATGKKLLDSDLIRNFILMQKDNNDEQEKIYNKYYKIIENNNRNDAKEILNFYRWFLAIKLGDLINKTEIYSEFKNYYNEYIENNSFEEFIEEIKFYSECYYNLMFKKIEEVNLEIRESVLEFRSINSDMPKPLLLEMYKVYSEKKIDAKIFNDIVKMVNIYIVRRGLCDLSTSAISRLFPRVLKDILTDVDNNNSYSNIIDYLKYHLVNENLSTKMYMPNDKEMFNKISESNMYKNNFTKLVFEKIENYGSTTQIDVKSLTVEHLMPQDGKKWYKKLGISIDDYENYNYRLGNLTLLSRSDNSKAKNNIFEKKKEIFQETQHIKLNIDIIKKNDWTIDDIKKRTEELILRINELYPYFKSDNIVENIVNISNPDQSISAVLFVDNGDVKLLKGTVIHKYNEIKDKLSYKRKWHRIFDEIENEEVSIFVDGSLELIDDFVIKSSKRNSTALSTTARLFVNHSIDGWKYWKDSNCQSLENNIKLKKYIKDDED